MKQIFNFCLLTIILKTTHQCSLGINPVCGQDLKTYKNICQLISQKINLKHHGPCSINLPQSCSSIYQPVCGKDGVTYQNGCTLKNLKMEKAYFGPCGKEPFPQKDTLKYCSCKTTKFQPVCGLDNYTYESRCLVTCLGILEKNSGPCDRPCNCKTDYRPVCGIDGLTYDNECALNCVGVKMNSYGPCPSLKLGCQFCSKVLLPVCSKSKITYRNVCSLTCQQKLFNNFGRCQQENQFSKIKKFVLQNRFKKLQKTPFRRRKRRAVRRKGRSMRRRNRSPMRKRNRRIPTFKEFLQYKMNQKFGNKNLLFQNPKNQCLMCPRVVKPICGVDGLQYLNCCFCTCKKNCLVKNEGNCQANCQNCTTVVSKVCSTSNDTFSNQCQLECRGFKFKYFGQCNTQKDMEQKMKLFNKLRRRQSRLKQMQNRKKPVFMFIKPINMRMRNRRYPQSYPVRIPFNSMQNIRQRPQQFQPPKPLLLMNRNVQTLPIRIPFNSNQNNGQRPQQFQPPKPQTLMNRNVQNRQNPFARYLQFPQRRQNQAN